MDAPAGAKSPKNDQVRMTTSALPRFVEACKTGKQYPGSFPEAEFLTEAVNLYAASLRANKMLKYDAASHAITNVADANKYLMRAYRQGWDPATI
jgi:hypothetical protein